tara:strand:+ start:1859 stop:2758 length:900 start_codon:yes stop_codon:yes gene_type:complete
MKVLVTGGAGFIGTNLIERLINDGHEVESIDNFYTGKRENKHDLCKYHEVDLRSDGAFDNVGEVDVIFHLAALARIQPSFTEPTETIDTNQLGTQRVMEWARNNDVSVVYAGSSSAHGDLYSNPYTFSKWQGEEIVKLYNKVFNVQSAICRFYNVYGPHQLVDGPYCTVIGIFEELYKKSQPLTPTWDGEQRRDFTHVYDIVDGLIKCSEALLSGENSQVNGEIFELGSGVNYSINQFCDMFGKDYPREPLPKRDGEMRETLCDTKPAYDIIGYKPKMNLEKYIKDLVETEIIKRGYDF